MMSSLIVDVCEIQRVLPHPNADSLEIAHVKGWQCLVRKGEFSPGDRIVYVPPDSVVPVELSDRLGVTKYLSKGRVRCAKLRGEPSFGLVFRPDDMAWPIGHNVAEFYGVTKYIPPLKATAGDAESDHPLFAKYTDIENMRHFPAAMQAGEEVVATEKIHGTNCRIGIIEGEYMAGSKELRRKHPGDGLIANNIYWSPLADRPVQVLLDRLGREHRQVILYGEVYGKVQSLRYGMPNALGFAAFDLMLDGAYVGYDEFAAYCGRDGVAMVPLVSRFAFSLDEAANLSRGRSLVTAAEHIREGVVVRPVIERHDPAIGRVILKYVSDDYLFSPEPDKEVLSA